MTVEIKLDVGSLMQTMSDRLIVGINKSLPILLAELKRLTPEDTKEMLNSFVVEPARSVSNSIVGIIRNDSDHAIYVEYGVGGLTYNYHKPKGSVFYKGVGNRTFARAVDNVRSKVELIILSELDA